jgi:hypothetical protein
MKPRFPISDMKRSFAGPSGEPSADESATPMSRKGLTISGAGRRLGISGMRRPLLETNITPDDTNEGLP